jgi:tetratricopeptide (TPR) repeat protein
MSMSLSISNLLSLLHVDRQDEVIKLCLDAESLRRRRHYPQAAAAVQKAIAAANRNFALLGIALLYSSWIRLAQRSPQTEQQARRECNRAIRNLSLDAHNQIVARLVGAQLELEIGQIDEALTHFYQAGKILQKLQLDARERGQSELLKEYSELDKAVTAQIEAISQAATEVPPVAIPEKTAAEPARIQLDIPTRLVWPEANPIGLEFASISGGIAPEYIEISQLPINGRTFAVQPIGAFADDANALRVQRGQKYLALQVEGRSDQYVLVRRQDRPDQDQQLVAVVNQAQRGAWVDESHSEQPYDHVHIIGAEREWTINDGSESTSYAEAELHIIGVVEALLSAVEAEQRDRIVA